MDEASGKAPRRKFPRASLPLLAALYLPAVGVLGLAALASVCLNVRMAKLMQDPLAIYHRHPLFGALSNLGVLLWCAAAATCLYAAALLRGRGDRRAQRFLLFSGLFTSVLALDDLFQVHEDLLERYLGIGESVAFFLATYGVLFVLYLAVCRRAILETDWSLLALAMVFFAVSQALDSFHVDIGRWTLLLEDGMKFFGIVSWFGYHVRASYHYGRAALQAGGAVCPVDTQV